MAKKRGAGEGTIFELPDGRWRASLHLGYRNGKRWRKVFEASTRSAVQNKLDDARRNQKVGLPVSTDRQTVGQLLDCWLSDIVKTTVKPKTYRTYSDIVKPHITPDIGRYPLAKLAPQHIRAFLNAKLSAPQPSRRKIQDGKLPEAGRPLNRSVVRALAELKARSKFCGPEDLVFATRNGTPLNERNLLRRTLKPAGQKLGLPWLSWHVFRHTHATLGGRKSG